MTEMMPDAQGQPAEATVIRWPARLGDGDFDGLYATYYQPVLTFFLRRGCSREECRDLAQETFARLHRSAGSFRGDSSLKTWVLGFAVNVLSEARKLRGRGKRRGEEVPLDQLPPPREEVPPEQLRALLAGERGQVLRAAIDELPQRMRECVLLRADGRTEQEIADLLRIRVGTVKSTLFDARGRLRERLGSYFSDL